MKQQFQNKILSFLILVFLFAPLFSGAWIMVPSNNITIDLTTQELDGNFHFIVKSQVLTCDQDGNNCQSDWVDYDQFDLQTQGLSATKTISLDRGNYMIIQDELSGLNLQPVTCVSDFVPDIYTPWIHDSFIQQENGITIYPAGVWENIVCNFDNKKITDKTPVLIVPGITGTEIEKNGELLWADIVRLMNPLMPDSFIDPLAFSNDLRPSDLDVSILDVIGVKDIQGIKLFDYTDGLIQEFISQGYKENETLFTFPYDWRYGVSGKYADGSPNNQAGKTNSDLLKEKIDSILQQTGSNKIDIIAHSMGGLITKKYVMDNPTTHKINKAVFVGVPNTGSVKAVKGLLWGDNMGVYFGPLGLSDSEMKKISANMPGVYDLLPSQQLYNHSDSFLQTIDYGNNTFTFPQIPAGSDIDIKDLDYQEYKSFLLQDNNLNQTAFSNFENLHTQDFDNFDLRATGIDLYAIDGCKTATMTKLIEAKGKNMLGWPLRGYSIATLDTGDGTVSIESSTNLPINKNNKFYSLIADHSKLLSKDGSRQQIVNIISNSNLQVSPDIITQDVSKCQLNGKAIEVFSPIDITVIDQFGNKLGLAEDKSIVNEITNASFDILAGPALPEASQDKHKFIYLPTDNNQTYTITLQGTGTGIYTINVKDIQNTIETKTETFSNLPVTTTLTGTINLSNNGSPTTLTIKETPSSQAITLLPGDYTPDTIPPEAIIEFDPIKKDLKFTPLRQGFAGQAEFDPDVVIKDQDDTITLTDKAGNTTEIKLKDKNRKITMKAEIKSIKYNNKLVDTSNNQMNFLWLYDKKSNLKMLTQRVMSKNGYNILAIYNGANTTLFGKDKSGYIMKTEKGLKILKVTTDKGNLNWNY